MQGSCCRLRKHSSGLLCLYLPVILALLPDQAENISQSSSPDRSLTYGTLVIHEGNYCISQITCCTPEVIEHPFMPHDQAANGKEERTTGFLQLKESQVRSSVALDLPSCLGCEQLESQQQELFALPGSLSYPHV